MSIAIDESLMSQSAKYADEIACDSGKTVQTELDEVNQNLSDLQNYTGSEEVVGSWFGKPLYRRSYEIDGSFSNSITIDSELKSSYAKYVKIDGSYQFSNGQWLSVWHESASNAILPLIMPDGFKVIIGGQTVTKVMMSVYYVKF